MVSTITNKKVVCALGRKWRKEVGNIWTDFEIQKEALMNGYEITGIGGAAFEMGPAHSKVKKKKINNKEV